MLASLVRRARKLGVSTARTGIPAERMLTVINRLEPSEGVFVYVLGLVVIATHPARFWLGFVLAMVPLLIGPLGRGIGGDKWNRL